MGLNSGEQKTYLKIKDGKFYKTSDKELKNPYKSLTGVIAAMRIKMETWENKPVEKLAVTVNSGGEFYEFAIPSDGSQFSKFLNFLSSVDITKEVDIIPMFAVKNGKNDRSILVSQNNKCKAYYTKDNPGDLPQLEKITFKGKDNWDNSKQLAFWKKKLETVFFPALSGNATPEPKVVSEPAHTPEEDEDDDLPF